MTTLASAISKMQTEETQFRSPVSEAMAQRFAANVNALIDRMPQIGDLKWHHSYNGLVSSGPGWMLCDGRQITLATYETEHGVGTWATDVGSTVLLNKYLPNLTGKYVVGAATTTQDGSAPITTVGNSGSTINIAHTHTMTHIHQWYTEAGGVQSGITFDATGTNQDIVGVSTGGARTVIATVIANARPSGTLDLDGTSSHNLCTSVPKTNDNALTTVTATGSSNSSSQDIRPESIQMQAYLRVS